MPKRKRGDDDGATPNASRGSKRLHVEVSNARKQLQHAFKLAKGFERQKLGRRRKTAAQQKDQEQTVKIDAEVEAWKTLDPSVVASTYLIRLVEREKALRESSALLSLCQTDKRLPNDHAAVNVAARLYNANPVKTTVADVLSSIRSSLGIKRSKTQSDKVTNTRAKEDVSAASDEDQNNRDMGKHDPDDLDVRYSEEDEDEDMGSSISREPGPDIGLGSDDEGAFDELEQRMLGSDSGSEASIDFEAVKASGEYRPERDFSITPPGSDAEFEDANSGEAEGTSDDQEDEASVSASDSEDLGRDTTSNAKIKAERAGPKATANDILLPSLSMGGYVSGSDSEASSIDEDAAPPRKNRRGQRARQAIWEKKFGTKAKHLATEKSSKGRDQGKGGRDAGWDVRRGATVDGDRGRGKDGWRPAWARDKEKTGSGAIANHASGGNATSVAPGRRFGKQAAKAEDRPMHPSWEAKLKAKQKSEQGTAAFSGTKMTFD